MKKLYRYIDKNLLTYKKGGCDDCGSIDKNNQPSLSLYKYIWEVLQEQPICGGTPSEPCLRCDCYSVNKFLFVSKPYQSIAVSPVENFDLLGLITCVLVNECGKTIEETNPNLYKKYCECNGCAPKEIHIPLQYLKKCENKGCLDCKDSDICLYNLIAELAIQFDNELYE